MSSTLAVLLADTLAGAVMRPRLADCASTTTIATARPLPTRLVDLVADRVRRCLAVMPTNTALT